MLSTLATHTATFPKVSCSVLLSVAVLAMTASSTSGAADTAPLVVETRIALGAISGPIDHLAFDPTRQRLYVAELGNNSVGVVDLKANSVLRTVAGFDEPQGIAY